MYRIRKYIETENSKGKKVLSVFLTSGFPEPQNFAELSLKVLDAGADMLEVGFPFSDPLADGPVIQHSSNIALKNGINLSKTFKYVEQIKKETDKPIILMGYANPVLSFGKAKFIENCKNSGVDGVIIPDVPIEEYANFFNNDFDGIDKVLLISPTTSDERMKLIDNKSEGFIYCVSVSGTTGNEKAEKDIEFIKRSYSSINKNKMLVGFGISTTDDVKKYSPFCDGIIVGSAVIKRLMNDDKNVKGTLNLIKDLKNATCFDVP
jgi:tryptophan synthase alpha chain